MKKNARYLDVIGVLVIAVVVSVLWVAIKPEIYWLFVWTAAGLFGLYLADRTGKSQDKILDAKVREEVDRQLSERGL